MRRKPPATYDPFAFDDRPVRRLVCSWAAVESDMPHALRALAQFRRANRGTEALTADRLTWGYAWTESAVLLDMNQPAEERAERRYKAVRIAVVFCRSDGKESYSADLPGPSALMMDAILDEEVARRSDVDWSYHEGSG